jgi:hypothetical protein
MDELFKVIDDIDREKFEALDKLFHQKLEQAKLLMTKKRITTVMKKKKKNILIMVLLRIFKQL